MKLIRIIGILIVLSGFGCEYKFEKSRTINGNNCTQKHKNGKDTYFMNGQEVPEETYKQKCS